MKNENENVVRIGRRAFLKNGTLLLASAATGDAASLSPDGKSPAKTLKVAMVTDLHYADKPPAGTRYYRETPDKLEEAAARFAKEKLEFIVELGDLIDAADTPKKELGYLKRINRDFSKICKNRHYVLGNHCVFTLTKKEFLDGVARKKSFYSFDSGRFHFVVLDSCFRSDGEPYGRKNFEWTDANIPDAELEWLKTDLKKTSKKTIVFAHQRLDVSNHYGVKNCQTVRKMFEKSGKVAAVFQGHSHQNDHKDINGIHYCTLVAMVEGSGAKRNGYSVMSLGDRGTIEISGFRKQSDYAWKK